MKAKLMFEQKDTSCHDNNDAPADTRAAESVTDIHLSTKLNKLKLIRHPSHSRDKTLNQTS